MDSESSGERHPFSSPNRTGAVFLYFLLVNFLISYGPFSLPLKPWLLLGGILIPMGLACRMEKPVLFSAPIISSEIVLPSFSIWLVAPLVVFAVFLRFYQLSTLTQWPLLDEAMFGYFGVESLRDMDFRLFYGIGQVPPLFVWVLGLFFKVFGVSISTLWALPALLSTLTLPLVFLSVRTFFGSATSYLFTWLWAFSFWPLQSGRFCVQYPLFMLWFWMTLCLLGLFLKVQPGASKARNLVLLSLAAGAGFYVSVSWLFVVVGLMAVIYFRDEKPSRSLRVFLPVVLTMSLPFVFSLFRHEYGNYLKNLWAFSASHSRAEHGENILHYFMGFFWGIPWKLTVSSYGPHWGGMLNPILGAFFFLGFLRLSAPPWTLGDRFLLGALLFSCVPAFLTKDLEFFRVFQVLPLLLFISVIGIQTLMGNHSRNRNGLILTGLLLGSLGLDLYHLQEPFRKGSASDEAWRYKSFYRYQAYQVLEKARQQGGPGLVLDQFPSAMSGLFPPRHFDPSLTMATFEYNVAVNPSYSLKDARWAGILCDAGDQAALSRTFPDAKWFRFSQSPFFEEDLVLGFIPHPEKYGPLLQRWLQADAGFRNVTKALLSHVIGESYGKVLRALEGMKGSVTGDFFLEACWKTKYDFLKKLDK